MFLVLPLRHPLLLGMRKCRLLFYVAGFFLRWKNHLAGHDPAFFFYKILIVLTWPAWPVCRLHYPVSSQTPVTPLSKNVKTMIGVTGGVWNAWKLWQVPHNRTFWTHSIPIFVKKTHAKKTLVFWAILLKSIIFFDYKLCRFSFPSV